MVRLPETWRELVIRATGGNIGAAVIAAKLIELGHTAALTKLADAGVVGDRLHLAFVEVCELDLDRLIAASPADLFAKTSEFLR
jgi:hypothetical protein